MFACSSNMSCDNELWIQFPLYAILLIQNRGHNDTENWTFQPYYAGASPAALVLICFWFLFNKLV